MISLARKHFFLRRAPAHFWASEFSTIPTARGDGVFGQGRVFGHMSGNATNSLLKNCFGSPFRAAKRRGTSLFVGFWRAVIPYCAHSSTFEILFQQAANRTCGIFKVSITRASSTGRCNTIQCVDSSMLPREDRLFGFTWTKPSQGSVPAGLASYFGSCFQCQVGSSLVLRRPIEITRLTAC